MDGQGRTAPDRPATPRARHACSPAHIARVRPAPSRPAGPRKGGLGAQHTLFQGPVLMRHTIDAYDSRGFANITGKWRYKRYERYERPPISRVHCLNQLLL